ncbi:hypothetical protein LEN26_018521 [Aphanomyces euteiches]|nr:hypothetical protein LEN26_018521 [Aphanomyces euteiches]KAH9115093.1 hypothetical protein AeMF1_010855 [Aphanomyces euteiches]KAH9189251.1 hypothetical protein AeNC1_008770 [Aphanomyces euteiches]
MAMTTQPPIELSRPHPPKTPAEVLAQLSADAVELGVTTQDFYGDFNNSASWLRQFQAEVAARVGKPRALFVPSGVMAQSIALKIYQERSGRNAFVARYNSHLLTAEKDSYKHLLHLDALVVPRVDGVTTQSHIRYDEVVPHLDNVTTPPASIVIELPEREVGGRMIPFEELEWIVHHARERGVAVHMDGARLWEAEGAFDHSLHEVAALFDSIYVSFYKGLGGITGAMLLGDDAFIEEAQVWLRRFGGNVYAQLPYAVSCWAAYRRHSHKDFVARRIKLQEVVAALIEALGDASPVRFDPPVPQVSMVHVFIKASVEKANAARDAAQEATGIRVYGGVWPSGVDGESKYELNMGAYNMNNSIETWVRGWLAFVDALKQ